MQFFHKRVTLALFLFNICIVGCYAQQITPEIFIEVEPNRYIVHFALPNYWFEEDDSYDYENMVNYGEEDDCGSFINIDLDADFDVTDIIDYPELPFFPINLLLPNYASNLQVSYMDGQYVDEYIDYYVTPALRGASISLQNGQTQYIPNDVDPCMLSSDYYQNGYDDRYPNGFYQGFYSISPITSFKTSEGFSFSIYPFSYHPESGYIRVMTEGTFYIDFTGGDVTQTIEDYLNSTSYSTLAILGMYDNFNNETYDIQRFDGPKFLIVASQREMGETLEPFVEYKNTCGFCTEVIYLEDYQAQNPIEIWSVINYNDILPNPDYVLLVGSLGEIPAAQGGDIYNNPYSDEPYHSCLGRWIIEADRGYYPSLESVVYKTIQTEQDFGNRNHSCTATLFSGSDASSRRMSKRFYKDLNKIKSVSFDALGLYSSLYDGRVTNVNCNTIVQSLQTDPSFFIYDGHGGLIPDHNYSRYVGSSIGSPYALGPSGTLFFINGITGNNINQLHNFHPFPMGFGFACQLNSYQTNTNFAASWVREDHGGVTFYGSTTETHCSSDTYLSKKIFCTLKNLCAKFSNFPISMWICIAESKYYSALMTGARYNQVYRYNLAGDPTLYVFGVDSSSPAPFHAPIKESEEYEDTKIEHVDVYDIYGTLIERLSNTADFNNEDKSLKIIKISYSNGITKTYKQL